MTNPYTDVRNKELLSWAVENIATWDDDYTHLRSDVSREPFFTSANYQWFIHSHEQWVYDDVRGYGRDYLNVGKKFSTNTPQVITKEEWSNGVLLREHAKIRIACDTVLETPSTSPSEPITGHVHADLMAEYALVAKTNPEPWKEFQQLSIISGAWIDLTSNPLWKEWKEYRRKPTPPKTMNIGGIVVEAWPLDELPNCGEYWSIIILGGSFIETSFDVNTSGYHKDRVHAGKAFSTKEQAQAVANALNLVYNRAIGKEG